MSSELAAQILGNEQALDNLEDVRARLKREKNVVDRQIQVAIESQANMLALSTSELTNARFKIGFAKDDLNYARETHNLSCRMIDDFETLEQLSLTVSNFDLARQFVSNFQNLKADLENIEIQLENDLNDSTSEYIYPNLFSIHQELYKLRKVKAKAFYYGKQSSQDTRITISKHFSALDKLIGKFDEVLIGVGSDILTIAQENGDRSLIVRVAKIIEYEEKGDFLMESAQTMQVEHDRDMPVPGRLERSKTNAVQSQAPRASYLKRFLDAVRQAISEKFTYYQEERSIAQAPANNLKILLKWVIGDLRMLRDTIVPCVPRKWKLMDIFVSTYHGEVYKSLQEVLVSDPPADTLLELLKFTNNYYDSMQERLGIGREDLTPPLLDGSEKELYDDFLALLVKKMREWYKAISELEQKPFILRETAPDYLDDNTFALNSHCDVGRMIRDQLESAEKSGQSRIVLGCINECCDILMQRQQEWAALVDQEVRKEISDDGTETQPGLFEYLIALANEQDRTYNFTDSLYKRLEQLPQHYRSAAAVKLGETSDGYMMVVQASVKGLINIILHDMDPAFKDLFTSKNWMDGTSMKLIINTLVEFIEDAKGPFLSEFFEIFTFNLAREVVLKYLRQIPRAPGSIKPSKGVDRIVTDAKSLFELFSDDALGLDKDKLRDLFKVFGIISEIIQAEPGEMATKFQELREFYWDAPLDLFEAVVALRKGISEKQVRVIMTKVRQAAVQAQPMGSERNEDRQKTFLSEFKLRL